MKNILRSLFLLAAVGCLFFMIYLVACGSPVTFFGLSLRFKNIKAPFMLLTFFAAAAVFLNPRGWEGIREFRDRLVAILSAPYALWVLFGLYVLLFTVQQFKEYFALQINFIPFGFYDYMLYYFFHGKITYTGLLHGYYHANFIMFLFAPFWKFFSSPLLLVASYGALAAAAIFPLHAFAKEKFKEPAVPFLIAFIYLNYRYLQNVLMMNFSVEIFYPLFLFSAFYFAHKGRWHWYYLAVFLGLLVKEDSFVYFSGLGVWVFFQRSKRWHGIATCIFSVVYFVILTKFVLPIIGSDILGASLKNYAGRGNSVPEIALRYLRHPLETLGIFFGSAEKMNTWANLLYRLLFLPLFSPAVLLILFPLFPLFLHNTGRSTDFYNLHFHYAAAVIPFVFIAFVCGFSNLLAWVKSKWREKLKWVLLLVLILINGGQYPLQKVTPQMLESIRWARELASADNVVTHGHLLPYVGYHKYNYYFAAPWELKEHPFHEPYMNADYYLIDLTVNPYPMDEAFLKEKINSLQRDARYRLVRGDDERFLFARKDAGL